MAEIVIKVGPGINYKDGDILDAFNDARIASVHLQHLTDHRQSGFNHDGLRPRDWRFDWLNLMYDKRLIRVNQTQAMVQTLTIDGSVESESMIEPGKMDVAEYFNRRTRHHSHRVYGLPGHEVYHGGEIRLGVESVNLGWELATKATGHLRGQECWCGQHHGLWTFGSLDLRYHLAIRVDDFSAERAQELIRSTETEKRVHNIPWRDLLLGTIRRTQRQVTSPNYRIGIKRQGQRTTLNHEPMGVAA